MPFHHEEGWEEAQLKQSWLQQLQTWKASPTQSCRVPQPHMFQHAAKNTTRVGLSIPLPHHTAFDATAHIDNTVQYQLRVYRG